MGSKTFQCFSRTTKNFVSAWSSLENVFALFSSIELFHGLLIKVLKSYAFNVVCEIEGTLIGLQALPVFFLLHFRRNPGNGRKTVAVLSWLKLINDRSA